MRQLAGLVLLGLTLCSCQQVPDLTRIPVPADGSVLNGPYSATFTEDTVLTDARVSPDGQSVYLLQIAGDHALLTRLDASDGHVLLTRALAVSSAQQLAFAPDGAVLVAGIGGSLAVDPVTLQPQRRLLGGTFSSDGTRLSVFSPGQNQGFDRQDTVTGAMLRTVAPTDVPVQEVSLPSHDGEWVAFNAGQRLQNLSSGQRLTVSGHPLSCDRNTTAQLMEATPDGFLTAESDGTLHWLDKAGRQLAGASVLGSSCGYTKFTAVSVNPDGTSFRLAYQKDDRAMLATWTPGQSPNIQALGTSSGLSLLPGSIAHVPEVLLQQPSAGSDPGSESQLNNVGRWRVPSSSPTGIFSATFKATYQDEHIYTLTGTVQAGGQTLTATGTGTTTGDPGGPGVVFTQAVCNADGLYAPRCPGMSWRVGLMLDGAPVGSLSGTQEVVNGPQVGRLTLKGTGTLNVLNQDGLNGFRSVRFSLIPK